MDVSWWSLGEACNGSIHTGGKNAVGVMKFGSSRGLADAGQMATVVSHRTVVAVG